MKSILSRLRPSPAMVIACLALGIALGGTSVAAIQALPRNSVGTKQLKANAVTSPKVKNNAITGADVNEASLAKVPAAVNADNAANAANATNAANAANATNAGNAANLGGQPPSAYASSSIVRYAAIAADGTISSARGVVQANVTHPSTGVYCINGLSPAPQGVTISLRFGTAFGSQEFAEVNPGALFVCNGNQIGVALYTSANAASNQPFTITIT